MTITHIKAAVAAATLFTLAACGQREPEVVGGPAPDATARAAANKAPVALPPAIGSSKVYRCKDNSIAYVNFMTDNVTANVRDKEESPPSVTLLAAAPGQPFVGQGETGKGFQLEGSGDTVTYTSPEGGAQSCKTK